MKHLIRIGNAQAFWGDRTSAAIELLTQEPDLDYLTMDYLAEVSMSILAQQRERDASCGYPQDFVHVVRGLAPYWANGGRCRLVANAGGLNPQACAIACAAALEAAGCRSIKIAVVSGDDVLHLLRADASVEYDFQNLDSRASLLTVRDRLITANAYLGAAGIVAALRAGADIVITGRVADPSMVVAPCVYEFQWQLDDWDRLAGATVAGHLLECGTQVTGGISTDWLNVPDVTHIGFPIAEIDGDGQCIITKPKDSGGHVTVETVKEQLIYEIGDPRRYLSPDVIVAFDQLQVERIAADRVRVTGARGIQGPQTLKVSATYHDGYRAAGMLTIFGSNAVHKARCCGQMILRRLAERGCVFRDTIVECLGNGESVPVAGCVHNSEASMETVLRIAVESDSRADAETFGREVIPLVTSGPPGTTGYAEGRPRVHSIFRYWPCLIGADQVSQHVDYIMTQATTASTQTDTRESWPTQHRGDLRVPELHCEPSRHGRSTIPTLGDIAFGRSGDKGTAANIGILAKSVKDFGWIRQWLTADRVQEYFEPLNVDAVERFELANLQGFNFVLQGVLRRGLRNDAQGKALAQALLAMPIPAADLRV
ncbi:MAG: DUF1446 domain-containing protein [Planctomycetota bacterium]|nr:DUF1446 domain-containing protein [Planctomycetota bacterium]